jgi:trans-aconitate methyltransferase
MPRVPENEVMSDLVEVEAYTSVAGSGGLSLFFVQNLSENIPSEGIATIGDLGCGCFGYAKLLEDTYEKALITGYDASSLMLVEAQKRINPSRTNVLQKYIPDSSLPSNSYDLVISSLCLHQLLEAATLWDTVKHVGKPGGAFAVFDLLRVEDEETAWGVINSVTPETGSLFKELFKSSLRAAYTLEELEAQLAQANLTATLTVQELSHNFKVVTIIGTL